MNNTRTSLGRPRNFDLDEALDRALVIFWRQGYEGTSLTDLTEAMGIGKPSMYAAFGNKEQLFRKALQRYTAGPGSYGVRALAERTAREVAEAFLRGAAEATTRPQCPQGCLGVQGALATGAAGRPGHDVLVEWRNAVRADLDQRFRRAVTEGDLPGDADTARLAAYVMTVAFGIAVQAATGLTHEELDGVVDMAMLAWRP